MRVAPQLDQGTLSASIFDPPEDASIAAAPTGSIEAAGLTVPDVVGSMGGADDPGEWVPATKQANTTSGSTVGIPLGGELTRQYDEQGKEALKRLQTEQSNLGSAQANLAGAQEEVGTAAQQHDKAAVDLLKVEHARKQAGVVLQQKFDESEAQRKAGEAQRALERNAQLESARKDFDAAVIEAGENVKIDPNRALNGGRGVAAAIAVALGGIGNAIAGRGGNQALDIVMGMVDKDIESQRSAIAGKQTKVAGKRTLLNDMRERFGDETQAIGAAKSARIQELQHAIEMAGHLYDSPEEQAKLTALSAGLAQEDAKLRATAEQQRVINAQKGIGLQSEVASSASQAKTREAQVGIDLIKANMPNGGNVPTEQLGKLAQQATMLKLTTDLSDAFKNKTGPFSFINQHLPSTQASDYEAQRTAFRQALTTFLTGAGVSGEQAKDYLEMVPRGSDWASEGDNKFKALMNLVATQRAASISTLKEAGVNTRDLGRTFTSAHAVAN